MATVILPTDPSTPLESASRRLSDSTPSSRQASNTIAIGTRRSALARVQASAVASQLSTAHPGLKTQIIAIDTTGDVDKQTALHSFNAKALWTTELEDLLERGAVDVIVHSLKDMPTQLPQGMVLGAVTKREDPRDALCLAPNLVEQGIKRLADLPNGTVVGTSSLRRMAQLKRRWPGLEFRDCRGNVGTRLGKLDAVDGEYGALILAAAGLSRLGLGARITQLLSWEDGGMMHAVGQGALGIEIREGDERTVELMRGVEDDKAWKAALAERSLMRTLEGGCSVPIGVETEWVKRSRALTAGGAIGVVPGSDYDQLSGKAAEEEDDRSDELVMRAIVVSLDGQKDVVADMRRVVKTHAEADQLGWDLAKKMVEGGAAKILEEINLNREIIQKQGDA